MEKIPSVIATMTFHPNKYSFIKIKTKIPPGVVRMRPTRT